MVSTAEAYRIICTVFHCLAISVTAFRGLHRWGRGKFYWDDIWAIVAAVLDSLFFIALWVRVYLRKVQATTGQPIPFHVGRGVFMMLTLSFTSALWAARVSILCSIMRLLPPGRTRRLTKYMMGLFGVMWLLLMAKKSCICATNKSWRTDCPPGIPFAIEKLTTDIISNIFLVAMPVYMLWDSTLPKGPRRMIRIVFAISITTTAISALHTVYELGPSRALVSLTAHVEAAVTLLICNLLVVVTYCYRALQNGRDLDQEMSEYLSSRSPGRLTIVSFTNISNETTMSPYSRGTSIFRDSIAAPSTNPVHSTNLPNSTLPPK